jgi:6-phosphogluconolactonase
MLIYVGSYTSVDRNGRGKGITVFRSAPVGSPWSHVQTLTTYDNPSLLRIAPGGRVLFAVHGGRTRVSAFSIEPHGQLAAFGSVGSGGENPVDIGFLAEGRFIVAANYTSGTVGLLRVGPDGAPQDPCQIIKLERPGYDRGGPLASMPHGVSISLDGNFVLIPNKGLDCIFVFRFDPAGQLVPADVPYASCKAGTGPRHAAFHPTLPILYVVGELGCSVQVFQWDATTGELRDQQVVSTLPGVAISNNLAAEIAVSKDGCSVYASNRGHNSITHFRVDQVTGLLGPAVYASCLGKEPRLFVLAPDGHALHVANQESDTITSFPLNEAGEIGAGFVSALVASPSSICFGSDR